MDKKIKIANFVKNITTIKEKIYSIEGNYIFNNSNKHKQVLIYYLYRIICKHYNFIKVNTDISSVDGFFNNLGLEKMDKCYPIAGEITNKKDELDSMITSAIELLELVNTTLKTNTLVNGKKEEIELSCNKNPKCYMFNSTNIKNEKSSDIRNEKETSKCPTLRKKNKLTRKTEWLLRRS